MLYGVVLGGCAEYGAAGSLDPTFATRTAPFQSAIPVDAALQADGKIVIAMGFDNSAIATDALGAVRYLSNGTLDKTFGKNGVALTAFTNFINSPTSVALQSDGKIVVAGTASSADGTLSEFVARFTATGAIDQTFGNGWQVTRPTQS